MTSSGRPDAPPPGSLDAPLPSWADQMALLAPVGDRLVERWRSDPSEAERQDMYRLALSQLASGYLTYANVDRHRPVWAPIWNVAMNQGGPVPDFVYQATEIDAADTYRISGFRGTSRFVEITQQQWTFLERLSDMRPAPATHDLDELTLGADGWFSVLLSAERPAGYQGDWWRLDPATVRLLMRKCACDWRGEVDARVAIERLDPAGPEPSPQEISGRFADLARWVEGMIGFHMELVRYYRDHHPTNGIERSKIIDKVGGLPNQVYYDGIHRITADEALIVETELPQQCRYWQILVADDRFATVDWVNRQSSLNDHQARLDGDGKFRAVISERDPGVPNWLDKAGWPWGVIQMRWNKASDHPDPVVTKVPFAEIRAHLPADTPVVTPEERAVRLAERRVAAQLRSLW